MDESPATNRLKTVGDYIEATRLIVLGTSGVEPISPLDKRVSAMMFDGVRLAAHTLPDDKESIKRTNEMLGLAHALVGANVDHEVRELHSLIARPGRNTADFEARLNDGSTVRIETCGLTNEIEQEYLSALRAIRNRASALLAMHPDVFEKSPYFVRFYGRLVRPQDIKAASSQLVELLLKEGRSASLSTSMQRAGQGYPVLYELGLHWTRLKDVHGRKGIILDPIRRLLSGVRPRDAFPVLFADKAMKYDDYSDGGNVPVWLTMYIRSSLTIPYGDM